VGPIVEPAAFAWGDLVNDVDGDGFHARASRWTQNLTVQPLNTPQHTVRTVGGGSVSSRVETGESSDGCSGSAAPGAPPDARACAGQWSRSGPMLTAQPRQHQRSHVP